eukprot:CAMPEP_0206499708 /NCGR_PEP_ID=MMETSP0324_2-20121206/51910_1 /ASSEMBLY_ACC=CAM_ASM_000836 /TAXON_ID=2866 /ORGANISM="Crypthecodinium cohnii, Strain Seligo" /LENGTH=81 /DNA_ID=CAMNT_0053986457 /DNA_START=33 /DNA_END=279 /DNA_ORIENTATION=-
MPIEERHGDCTAKEQTSRQQHSRQMRISMLQGRPDLDINSSEASLTWLASSGRQEHVDHEWEVADGNEQNEKTTWCDGGDD